MKLYRIGENQESVGILDLESISQKKILFLGLGSLGSLAVANLAYPFKQIVLVDPEVLDIANVERHLLGLDAVGKPKVDGICNYLINKGLNPASIKSYQSFANSQFLDQHQDADLLVVSIDHKRSCVDINDWCVKHRKPALYGGVYAQGVGGNVLAITNPGNACYLCGQFFIGADLDTPAIGDYGIDISLLKDEQPTAVPSLHWPINSIACNIADLALAYLKHGSLPSQVLFHYYEWGSVKDLYGPSMLNVLAEYISLQSELGIIPNLRLKSNHLKNGYSLQINRSTVSLNLVQWVSCPMHSADISLADI